MGNKTKIEWCDYTVNPIRVKGGKVWKHGYHCTKETSPGCANCYAERMNIARGTGKPFTKRDVQPYLDLSVFDNLPITKPCRVFVQDMSDLFHETVPFVMIRSVFSWMHGYAFPDQVQRKYRRRGHTCLLLTKRPKRMLQYSNWENRQGFDFWSNNIWPGVTVCNQKELWKIDTLRQIPADLKFISFEPLLEDVGKLDLSGIGLIIVGCESGPKRRPCKHEWIELIVRQGREAGVPVFVKQVEIPVNGYPIGHICCISKLSHDMSEWPESLRVRDLPEGE